MTSTPTLERVTRAIKPLVQSSWSKRLDDAVDEIARAALAASGNDELVDTLEKLRADLNEEDPELHAQRIAVIDWTLSQAAIARTQEQSDG